MRLNTPSKTTVAGRRRRYPAILIVVLLIAALLRFWGLGAKSLWLDEVMTVLKASKTFAGMMSEISGHDAHPPLFQIVEWLWLRLGRGDAFARVPMAVAGVIAVWLTWIIARRLLGRTAGLVAAALMSVSYFHVYYSQDARLHAMVVAIVLGQTYVLLRIIHQRGKAHWTWWTAYALLALAGLYTYVLCILTVAALGLVYLTLAWKRRRIQIAQFIVVHLIVALLFLPWVPTLRATTARVRASLEQRGDDRGRPTPGQLASGVASWAIGPVRWETARPPALGPGLGAALLILAGVGLCTRRTSRPARVLAALFFIPLLGYVALPMPRVHLYDPKHLVFLQPFLIIALAGFRLPVRRFGAQAVRPAIYLALALAAVNVWMLTIYYGERFEKENWRAVAADIRPRFGKPGRDAVVFNPEVMGFPFSYALHDPKGEKLTRKMAALGAPLNPEFVARLRLQRPGDEPTRLAETIRRVWLVQCKNHMGDPTRAVLDELKTHGFEYAEGKRYHGHLGYVQWMLFVRSRAPTRETAP